MKTTLCLILGALALSCGVPDATLEAYATEVTAAASPEAAETPGASERIRDLLFRFEHELHALQAEILELRAELDRLAGR